MDIKIGIGLTFETENDNGVILQSCKNLPKFHNREDEVGPFFGVHYENSKYVWYSKDQLQEFLKECRYIK